MDLTEHELNALPSSALVEDVDGDVWQKQASGYWSLVNRHDDEYGNEPSYRLILWGIETVLREDSGPFTRSEESEQVEISTEPTIEGVWLVWGSVIKENLIGIFPGDAEINALRMVNKNGYGLAEFQPFGGVDY